MADPADDKDVLCFGDFVLDLRRGCLRNANGAEIPLRPKSFDALEFFVRNAGQMLRKDKVLDAVWPNVHVTEGSLVQCVRDIRRALRDETGGMLRTIARKGYIFDVEVRREGKIGAVAQDSRQMQDARTVPDRREVYGGGQYWAPDIEKDSRDVLGGPATPAQDGNEALALQSTSRLSDTERRQLTIMQCAVGGAALIVAQHDPEDLLRLLGAFHESCAALVTQAGGTVAKLLSDGVLAFFGYPHADEHQADRAVRAALGIVKASSSSKAETSDALHVRIGIATGVVVVGPVLGVSRELAAVGEAATLAAALLALADPATAVTSNERHADSTDVGEPPNLAASLSGGLAGAGQVVIDAATRWQIGNLFDCQDLSTVEFKDLRSAVPAWRVLSENHTLGQFEALRSGATPLVDRDEEIELLLRRWAQAKAGNGRVVLISAEPGVGKSRLASALIERISTEPHVRLRYFCSPHHQDSAFYPAIAQMERAAGFAHADGPVGRLAKLHVLLAAAGPSPEDVALIAELHSLSSVDLAPRLDVTPQRKKDKTFEALLRQHEGLSRQRPLLMVFDDIHWIDPSSRELLDRTIERVAGWPVMLLAMFRPEFQPPWTGQPHVTMLTLPRLDRRDTTAMVENVAGKATLSAEIAGEIAARTDGVPLFVEELTKAVLESGAYAPAPLSSHPSVPATLQASLMARLDRLGPAAKEVARIGAAIGREFEFRLLSSIADLPEPQLHEALDRLANAGLLFVRGAPPESRYIFKHALVQDAAYGTLLRGRRQRLHARIAATMEDRFHDIVLAQPALLAQHCAAAGLAEKAVAYWLKAGQRALARSAMAEAVAQFRKGLDALADLPDSEWRQQHELDLQSSLGMALTATKGWATMEVDETLARARALAEQLDRPEYLVPLIASQWASHFVRSEHGVALALGEQLEQIGEARNDAAAQSLGRMMRGIARYFLGEFIAARVALEQCMDLADPAHRTIAGLAFDPYSGMLAWLAMTLACLGYIDQARARMEEALLEARQLRHVYTLAHVLGFANRFDWLTRSPMVHIEEDLALATEHGFPHFLGRALAFRGRSLIALGRAQEGLALLTQGLAELRATGGAASMPMLFTWLAEAHASLGQRSEERNCLAEAARIIETTAERVFEAELLHRVPGDLLNAAGDQAGAERHYRQAIAIAERQSAKLFQLRASTSLARLWRDHGKRAEASDLLGPIYTWFTEGFDAPDLKDAKALLEALV